jgi:hypothetical protein
VRSRATAKGQPSIPTESAKISGSIVGEATQKAITGVRGTPATRSPATSGTTVHEQKGLKAPTAVASSTAKPMRASRALRIAPSSSSVLIRTPKATLRKKTGRMSHAVCATNPTMRTAS